MKGMNPILVLFLVTVASASFAGETRSAHSNRYSAPWTEWSPPPYRDFVLTYARDELNDAKTQEDREKIAETVLMSSADTYDGYMAAKETGYGVSALLDDALVGVERDLSSLVGKKYFLRSTWEYYAYDPKIEGFPVFEPPATAVTFDYPNPEVKHGEYVSFDNNRYTQAALGRGMSLQAHGFQLGLTKLSLDLDGWAIPATRERAADLVRRVLKARGKRTIGVIAVYTLSRCQKTDAYLKCYGKIESAYVYADGHSIKPDMPPLFELVRLNSNIN